MTKSKKKRFSKYSFAEDASYRLFRDSITSQDTRFVWTNYLHNYMAFHKMTKYSDLLEGNPKLQQARLIEYVQHKKTTIRAQSIGSQLTGIRHFYWINEYEGINWDRVRYFLGEAIKAVDDKPYVHEQIGKLLAASKPRIRIVEYSEAQGGPRIGAFPIIKKGDLSDTIHEDITRVVIYRGTPAEYVTFFGPEATREIKGYFAYRERCGEVLTPNSPLIREEFDPKDKFQVEHPKTINKRTLERQINYAAVAAGLRTVEKGGGPHKRKENMLTHGLRKFFKQQCRRAGVDPIVIEYLVGHKNGDSKIGISKLMMTYDPAMEDELLKEYMKAVDNLTISEENRAKRRNILLEKDVSEISALKERVEKQEQRMHQNTSELAQFIVDTVLKNEREEQGMDPAYLDTMSRLVAFTRRLQDDNIAKKENE